MPTTEENEKIIPISSALFTRDSINIGLMYDIIPSAKEIKNAMQTYSKTGRFFTDLVYIN